MRPLAVAASNRGGQALLASVGRSRRTMTLHLTGPALWFFETSRSLQPARQVIPVVSGGGLLWQYECGEVGLSVVPSLLLRLSSSATSRIPSPLLYASEIRM